MEAKPGEEPDVPDPKAISGKVVDASAAFGGGAVVGRDAESRLNDLSGTPDGFPKAASPEPRETEPDEDLQQILGGEVPKSTGAQP